jgi:hypothetical protein
MKDRIRECEIYRDNRSIPSISEEGKTFQLDNKNKEEVACIQIDGCVFTTKDGKKCDFLFEVSTRKKLFYIELKGSDISKALRQIYSTLIQTKTLYPNWIYEARIVAGNKIPKVIKNRKEYNDLYEIVEKSKGRLIIQHKDLFLESI